MKVYIVTKYGFPNGMAATRRIKCYARAIHDGGMKCEVIVCSCTELQKGKIKNTEARGIYEGVPFRYIGGTTTDTRPEPIRRFAQYLRLLKTERFLSRNLKKGDVLFFIMKERIDIMLRLMKIAHKRKAFCIRDLCELPYGTGEETEKNIRLRKDTIEKQFPILDGIISISDTLCNLAKTYTRPSCKHIKVPIMVEFEHYKMANKAFESETPYIFHAGTLSQQKDGILGMIEAFGMAVGKITVPIKFVSTGKLQGAKHENGIKHLIAQYGLEEKIQFTGYLTEDELKENLSKATMVIINKYRTQQNNYCFSTKLGEYLAAAKPVIITNVGEALNWLEDGKSAIVVEAEDTEALVDAIVRVFNNPDEAQSIGQEGQEVCRCNFDYRVWSKPLVEFFNHLGD